MPDEEDISRFVPPPPDENLTIWRYIDFTKYLALLESESLFFVRVATLDDPFEGSFPPAQTVISRVRGAFPPGTVPPDLPIQLEPGLADYWKIMRYWAMVSCWHASEYESAAMWRLYAPTTAAIAIRSTVRGLRAALGTAPSPPTGFGGSDRIHIGMIQYIDFATETIPDGSFAAQFYRKRRSFEHERELRAMVLQFPRSHDGHGVDLERRPADAGIAVSADLAVLIQEIRIAPQAPAWYAELVTNVTSRYGLNVVPVQSELDATPVY
jgi:hypothetical protein